MQWIEHADGVYSVPNFMTLQTCQNLVLASEAHGYEAAQVRMGKFTDHTTQSLPNIRNNEKCIIEMRDVIAIIWDGLKTLPLPTLEEQTPVGLPSTLRFYRYHPGQRFKMHKDGAWEENGLWSRLTLLIYLNDGVEGGETDFQTFKIQPAVGTLVLFRHKTWHEGTEVKSGVKYVLRSDVLYGLNQ